MNNITYSFIIPHHNTPDLLQRCVDSIPQRDDIEIIVADDNSQEGKKANVKRPDVKTIYIDKEQSCGAGHARNVAMAEAKGKWLLFADADDYYHDGFIKVLDQYRDSDFDLIYFNVSSVYSDTMKPANRTNGLRKGMDNVIKGIETYDLLRYKYHTPWNKMYSADMVKRHHLQFEEVMQGNDCMFSYMAGYFSKKIKVISEDVYVYTYTVNSITTSKFTTSRLITSLKNQAKQRNFLKFVGHEEWSYTWVSYYSWMLNHQGPIIAFRLLLLNVIYLYTIMVESKIYIEFAKNHSQNV